MQTVTFELRFSDGKCLTALLNANSCLEDVPVSYRGPLSRLPLAPVTASGVELRAYLRSFARELGATLTENTEFAVETEESQPGI